MVIVLVDVGDEADRLNGDNGGSSFKGNDRSRNKTLLMLENSVNDVQQQKQEKYAETWKFRGVLCFFLWKFPFIGELVCDELDKVGDNVESLCNLFDTKYFCDFCFQDDLLPPHEIGKLNLK